MRLGRIVRRQTGSFALGFVLLAAFAAICLFVLWRDTRVVRFVQASGRT